MSRSATFASDFFESSRTYNPRERSLSLSPQKIFPENDLSIAQKLAKRYLKHQKLQDDLMNSGFAPISLQFNAHVPKSPQRKKKALSVRVKTTCPAKTIKPKVGLQPPFKKETCQNKRPVRSCEAVVCKSTSLPSKVVPTSQDELEVAQMRRAIKFYTNKLVEMKNTTPNRQQSYENLTEPSKQSERCLNSQISRKLYALTQQLHNPIGSGVRGTSSVKPNNENKALTLQQLNVIHKSAIRCLNSFVHQHETLATEREQSPTCHRDFVPPVPSGALYRQLCSLLEMLSYCYNQHGSVEDSEFLETIQQLKSRLRSPSPVTNISHKSSALSLGKDDFDIGKRKTTVNNQPTVRVRSQTTPGKSVDKSVVSQTFSSKKKKKQQSPSVRRNRSSSRSNRPFLQFLVDRNDSRQTNRRPSPNSKQSQFSPPKSQSPDNNVRLVRADSITSATGFSPRRQPCNCDKSVAAAEIRHRMQQMEAEASVIRQKWLTSASYHYPTNRRFDTAAPLSSTIHKEQKFAERDVISAELTEKSPVSSLPVCRKVEPVVDFDDKNAIAFLNGITKVVENRIMDGVIEDVMADELDRFESIASRLAEHLLQTELFVI